jgi:hypothetical protein
MRAQPTQAPTSLRIDAGEVKRRLESGEPTTFLDSRGAQAWDSSDRKVTGAIRVPPDAVRIDPSWPRDRLTVVY